MLKLKFQYFGHLMGRVDSLEKTLMLGGIGGRRKHKLESRLLGEISITISSDFGAPKIKSVTVSIVAPSICHEVMGLDIMILVF